MKKENDFFERCFGIVARLEVENENQEIAKEVVLDEIKNLQQENQQLKERIEKAIEYINGLEDYPMLTRYNCLELLSILKGEEK